MRALLGTLLLAACTDWSTIPVLRDAAPPREPATLVYYSTAHEETRLYTEPARRWTSHSMWRLQLSADAATLAIRHERTRGKTLVFRGELDETNAEVPSLFEETAGPDRLALHCNREMVPVHPRGSSLQFRCDDAGATSDGWTADATPILAIACTQEPSASSIDFNNVGVIVFANPPVEEIRVSCWGNDFSAPLGGGYRFAGGGAWQRATAALDL